MTESDAKQKWCPMVRNNGIAETGEYAKYTPSGNCESIMGERGTLRNPIYARCIASDCMMWVATDNMPAPDSKFGDDFVPAGYCGLAGKP